jgi:hypothetical protein
MPAGDDRLERLEQRVDQLSQRLVELELRVSGADAADQQPPGIHPPAKEFSWPRRR